MSDSYDCNGSQDENSNQKDPRDTAKKVFYISEGKTESDYLEAFSNARLSSFNFKNYSKDGVDRDQSDRDICVRLLYGWVQSSMGLWTPYYFATIMIDALFDYQSKYSGRKNKSPLIEDLHTIRDELIADELNNKEMLDPNGFLLMEQKNWIFNQCESKIKTKCISNTGRIRFRDMSDSQYGYQLILTTINNHSLSMIWEDKADRRWGNRFGKEKNKKLVFNPQRDKLLFIFDRDYWDPPTETILHSEKLRWKQSPEHYRELIEKCEELGITCVLSTPLFEYWLLMHHKDALTEISKIPQTLCNHTSDIIIAHLRDIERWGKDEGNGKIISPSRRAMYMKLLNDAVEISKSYETNLKGLINNPGSNMGIVLEELIKSK